MNGGPIRSENIYFGDPWPEVGEWRQVQVPKGMKCVRCGDRFVEGDQGTFEVKTEGPYVDWYPKHRTCEPSAEGS